MTHKIKQTKLDTKLIHNETAQTNTRLKFTDYATERFQGSFIGNDGMIRSRVRTPYYVSKSSYTHGLEIFGTLFFVGIILHNYIWK